MAKKVLIIQARMGSTRLPGKMMLDVGGIPLIERVIHQAKACKSVDLVVLATGDGDANDVLCEKAKQLDTRCFRGNESDVLDRFYKAAEKYGADIIIRVTGDCPFLQPSIVNEVVESLIAQDVDYACNTQPPTYPDGIDVEVMKFSALRRAWTEAKLPSDREHVTPFIWKRRDLFTLHNVAGDSDLSNIRLTIDEPNDLFVANAIMQYSSEKFPNLATIMSIIKKHPEVLDRNRGLERNEGYRKSLEEDTHEH
ncbi:glycosyltransferase family protein [Candidatus Woesearchaeota archaeon]|nr:glycosyltransferase family protein [Candidatus Woesearchaeota archaeon]